MLREAMEDTMPIETLVNLSDLDFDTTPLSRDSMKKTLDTLGKRYINKYDKKGERDDLAVISGRFQPPHLGHLFQILAGLEVADHVAIVLGSANADINNPHPDDPKGQERDTDNPFPAEERAYLLTHFLKKIGQKRGEDFVSRVSFVPVDDVWNVKQNKWYDDEAWMDRVQARVGALGKGRIDVIVANDGWVKKIAENRGLRTLSVDLVPMNDGNRHEARLVRDQLRESNGTKPVLAKSGPHRVRRV